MAEIGKKVSAIGIKLILKWFGIIFGGILGATGGAVVYVGVTTNWFQPLPVQIQSFSFEEPSKVVIDDFTANFTYLPANADDLTIKLTVSQGANAVEVPATVQAGTPFEITLKKTAAGHNIGGEVTITAAYVSNDMIRSGNELKIVIDVAIPNNGLKMFTSQPKEMIANTSAIDVYVYTDPANAINPYVQANSQAKFKNVQVYSSNNQSLSIVGAPVKQDAAAVIPGLDNVRRKYLKYSVKPGEVSGGPVYMTASVLRSYFMQEDFVNKANYPQTDLSEYYQDLSAYLEKYKQYIINDPRPYVNTFGTTVFSSGADFITKSSNAEGVVDITTNINQIEDKVNAADMYMYVEVKLTFEIINVNIDKLELNASNLKIALHTDVWQMSRDELISKFGIVLSSSEGNYNAATLRAKVNEIKITPIRHSATEDYELAEDVFSVTNPSNVSNPVWIIRALNPVLNEQDGTRLRFSLTQNVENPETGELEEQTLFQDIYVEVEYKEITSFAMNIPINQRKLTVNKKGGLDGELNIMPLTSGNYELKGSPTYQTVKYFITSSSAKTASGKFKLKMNEDGSNPVEMNMSVMVKATETPQPNIKAYEITNQVNNQTILEALNITDSDLELFAAVIKTDYEGNPVLDEDGNYILIKKTNAVNIEIISYLEGLNIYTRSTTDVFTKRNITSPTNPNDIVKLLVGGTYNFYLTNLELNSNGTFNSSAPIYSNNQIDYKANLNAALNAAISAENLEFTIGAQNLATTSETYGVEINGIKFIVVQLSVENATSGYYPALYADFANTTPATTIREKSQTRLDIKHAEIMAADMYYTYQGEPANGEALVMFNGLAITAVANQGNVQWQVGNKVFQFGHPNKTTLVSGYFDVLEKTGTAFTSNKLDISFNTEESILSIVDILRTNVSLQWSVREQDKQYISVTQDGNVPTVTFIKGLPSGAEIQLSCDINYYPVGNTFTKNFRSTVTLKLVQGEITYKTYSPVYAGKAQGDTNTGAQTDATLRKYYIANNGAAPLILYGSESYNLLALDDSAVKVVEKNVPEGYKLKTPAESTSSMFSIRMGDESIIGACTFTIRTASREYAYFIGADGKPTNTTKAVFNAITNRYELYIYTNSTNAQVSVYIDVTTALYPNTITYDVTVFSNIKVDTPKTATTPAAPRTIEAGLGIAQRNKTGELTGADATDVSVNLMFNDYIGETSPNPLLYRFNLQMRQLASKDAVTGLEAYYVTDETGKMLTSTDAEYTSKSDAYRAAYTGVRIPVRFELAGANDAKYAKVSPVTDWYSYIGHANNSITSMSNGTQIKAKVKNEAGGDVIKDVSLNVSLTPYQVQAQRNVTLKIYYYVPIIESIDKTTTPYTYNYKQENGQVVYEQKEYPQTYTVIIKNHVSVTKAAALNTALEIKSGQEDYNLFSLYASTGVVGGTTNFIDIKDVKSSQHISYEVEGKEQYSGYIKLQYNFDESNLKNIADLNGNANVDYLSRVKQLFTKNASDLQDYKGNMLAINTGEIATASVNFDLTMPVDVYFLERENDGSGTNSNPVLLFSFNIKFVKSVTFTIQPENRLDSPDYVLESGQVNKSGHTYNNNHINDETNVIEIQNFTQTLFTSKTINPSAANIVEIIGGGDNENLTEQYLSEINLYKYNSAQNKYELVNYNILSSSDNDTNNNKKIYVNWVRAANVTQRIVLNLLRSSNEKEFYKLEFISGTLEITGDYYFTLEPTFVLRNHYPIETNIERVTNGNSVNLRENYINPRYRTELYKAELVATSLVSAAVGEEGQPDYVPAVYNYSYEYDKTIRPVDANDSTWKSSYKPNYRIETQGAKIFAVNVNDNTDKYEIKNVSEANLFKYEVISGSDYVSLNSATGEITFNSKTTELRTVTVRVFAFNGSFTDYNFEIWNSISATDHSVTIQDGLKEISPEKPLVVYANRPLNLLNYIQCSVGASSANDKLIIKYKHNPEAVLRYGVLKNIGTEQDPNMVFEYSEENLVIPETVLGVDNHMVMFENVSKVFSGSQLIKFDVYTTNSVNGRTPKTLYIKLMPNFEVTQKATAIPAGADQARTLFSAGGDNSNDILQIATASDTAYPLKVKIASAVYVDANYKENASATAGVVGNAFLQGITLAMGGSVVNAANNNYININNLTSPITVTLKSKDIGSDINITIEVVKYFDGSDVADAEAKDAEEYVTTYSITLRPNIDYTRNYTAGKEYKELRAPAIADTAAASHTIVSPGNVEITTFAGASFSGEGKPSYSFDLINPSTMQSVLNASGEITETIAKQVFESFDIGQNGYFTFKQVNKTFRYIIKVIVTWPNDVADLTDNAFYSFNYAIQIEPNLVVPQNVGGTPNYGAMVNYIGGSGISAMPVYAGSTIAFNFNNLGVNAIVEQGTYNIKLNMMQTKLDGQLAPANVIILETSTDLTSSRNYEISSTGGVGSITFGAPPAGGIISVPLYVNLKGDNNNMASENGIINGVIKPPKMNGEIIDVPLMDIYQAYLFELKFEIVSSVRSLNYKNNAPESDPRNTIDVGALITQWQPGDLLERNQYRLINTELFDFLPVQNGGRDLVSFNKAEAAAQSVPYVDISKIAGLFNVEFFCKDAGGNLTPGAGYVKYDRLTGIITFKPYTTDVTLVAKISIAGTVRNITFTIPKNGMFFYNTFNAESDYDTISGSNVGDTMGNSRATAINISSAETGKEATNFLTYLYVIDIKDSNKGASAEVGGIELPSAGDVSREEYDSTTGLWTIVRITGVAGQDTSRQIVYKGYKLKADVFNYSFLGGEADASLTGTVINPKKYYSIRSDEERIKEITVEILPGVVQHLFVNIAPVKAEITAQVDTTLSATSIGSTGLRGWKITPTLSSPDEDVPPITEFEIIPSQEDTAWIHKQENNYYLLRRYEQIAVYKDITFTVKATIKSTGDVFNVMSTHYNIAPKVYITAKTRSLNLDVNNNTSYSAVNFINEEPVGDVNARSRFQDASDNTDASGAGFSSSNAFAALSKINNVDEKDTYYLKITRNGSGFYLGGEYLDSGYNSTTNIPANMDYLNPDSETGIASDVEDGTAIYIWQNEAGTLENANWVFNSKTVLSLENISLYVRLYKISATTDEMVFEQVINLVFNQNAGIFNLKPAYEVIDVYMPKTTTTTYEIDLNKGISENKFMIDGASTVELSVVSASATQPKLDENHLTTIPAGKVIIGNGGTFTGFDKWHGNFTIQVLNEEGKQIQLAGVALELRAYKENGELLSAVKNFSINFAWLKFRFTEEKTYSKDIIASNKKDAFTITASATPDDILLNCGLTGDYEAVVFESTSANNNFLTNAPAGSLTDYNVKYLNASGTAIGHNGVGFYVNNEGLIVISVAEDTQDYKNIKKIELWLIAKGKPGSTNAGKYVASVMKKVVINLTCIELENFLGTVEREYIYNANSVTSAIIELPDTPFTLNLAGVTVAYTVVESKTIIVDKDLPTQSGGNTYAMPLTLRTERASNGKMVQVLTIPSYASNGTTEKLEYVIIRAVISRGTPIGELEMKVKFENIYQLVNTEAGFISSKNIVGSEEIVNVYNPNGLNKKFLFVNPSKEEDSEIGIQGQSNSFIEVGGTESKFAWDFKNVNVFSSLGLMEAGVLEFNIDENNRLTATTTEETGATAYRPINSSFTLVLKHYGINIFEREISCDIAWPNS